MGKLVQRTVEELDQAKEVEDLRSCLWVASDLLTKASSANFISQFEEIDREEVSDADRKQLQEALLNALSRNSEPRWVGQILSSLSSSRDPSLLRLWVDHLAKYLDVLKAANGIVYATLTALHDLGEPVFEDGRQSRSILAIEQTVKSASRYLHQRGVTVPW
jgi:hypothetical protein